MRVTSPVLGANPGDLIELDPEDLDEAAKYLAGGHLVRVAYDDVVLGAVAPEPPDIDEVPADQLPDVIDSLSTDQLDELLSERGLATSGRVGARRARLLEALTSEG